MIHLTPKNHHKYVFFHALVNTFTSVYHAADLDRDKVVIHYPNKHLGKFLEYYPGISVTDDIPITAKSIAVAPLLLHRDKDIDKIKTALLDLRERIYSKLPKPEKEQILIIQRQHNRIFLNLDKIFTACKKYMPTVIFDFDTLSFPEQVKQIINSKIVLAAHGSALSHIAFSTRDTIFIEVRPKFFVTECFTKLTLLFDRTMHTLFSKHDPRDQYKDLSLLSLEDIERLAEKDRAIKTKVRDATFIDLDIEELDALLSILTKSQPA